MKLDNNIRNLVIKNKVKLDNKYTLVVGGDQSWLKNEVICVNLTIINNDF